jgi:hypothetical protein
MRHTEGRSVGAVRRSRTGERPFDAAARRGILTRRAVLLLTALLAAFLALAAPAAAATALGETDNPYPNVICRGPSTYLQETTGRTPSYTVPAGGGVITSWSTFAPADRGGAQVKLGVFRATGAPGEYTTVAASAPETLTAGSLNAFPTSIPVQAGDTLGLLIVAGEHNCIVIDTGSPQDRTQREEGALFDPGAVHTYNDPSQPARRVNVAARLEADADGDGIGDEAPETKITKGAPKKTDKNKITFKFSSDDPVASFQCKLDRKAFKACPSPKTLKHLDVGKHTFAIRAVDPDGHRDPSPAKDRFRVVD